MTINSLFYNINKNIIEDWTGFGFQDLTEKVARTPLEPLDTLKDDPLRILRIIRFASRFGLRIEKDLLEVLSDTNIHQWIKEKVSRERIRIEFEKMMKGVNPSLSIELLEKFSLFKIIFMVNNFEVKNALKVIPDLKAKAQVFEKYITSLIYHFSPTTPNISQAIDQDISNYICTHSLKLSKKQKELIQKYLHHLPYLDFYSKQFDASEVGLIIHDLGESWKEILDLLPEQNSQSLLSSIKSHNLESFYSETPLIKVNINRETSFHPY